MRLVKEILLKLSLGTLGLALHCHCGDTINVKYGPLSKHFF